MNPPEFAAALPVYFPWIAVVFLLAGAVKGVIGLGLPTIAVALLALVMAPAEAAALLIVPSLLTNAWQMRPWPALPALVARLWPMQAGVIAGTLGAAWLFGAPHGRAAMVSLGVALILYAAWSLAGLRLHVAARLELPVGAMVGACTGAVTAVTGVFAIPAVPYLQALGLEKDELVQAMGLSFTVSTLALAVGLYANRSYPGAALGMSVLMVVPALAGMWVGQLLRQRMSPAVFRTVFLSSLIVLGVHIIVREMLH